MQAEEQNIQTPEVRLVEERDLLLVKKHLERSILESENRITDRVKKMFEEREKLLYLKLGVIVAGSQGVIIVIFKCLEFI